MKTYREIDPKQIRFNIEVIAQIKDYVVSK